MIRGRCMCGAVTVTVAKLASSMSACHCDMCRRWTGSAFVSVHARGEATTWDGPVKVRTTSDWAERGWCAACGSTLFYRVTADGSLGLSAGLFDDAAGRTMSMEYFVDQKPAGFAFTGDHRRLTAPETLAHFGFSEGDDA